MQFRPVLFDHYLPSRSLFYLTLVTWLALPVSWPLNLSLPSVNTRCQLIFSVKLCLPFIISEDNLPRIKESLFYIKCMQGIT